MRLQLRTLPMYDPQKLSVLKHSRFRSLICEAIPFSEGWRGARHPCPDQDRWRADILIVRGGCLIALEAQRADECIESRSRLYLQDSVWPVWFFLQVPSRLKTASVFSVLDLPQLPKILNAVHDLGSPKGLSWERAQLCLKPIVETHRGPELTIPPLKISKCAFNAGFKVGFEEGRRQGWAHANKVFREALGEAVEKLR